MSFPGNAYLLAFLGGLLVTAGAVPLWRAWCERHGWVDDPGHRKIHGSPIPLAGGLAVFSGMAAVVLGGIAAVQLQWLDPVAVDRLAYGLGRRRGELAAILLGALSMLGLGAWDDRRELRPPVKFIGQAAVALLVAASGIRITLFVPSAAFSYAVTVLWILSVTNAMNFNDNMNGLCAGLGVIGTGWIAWHAASEGQYLVALLALLAAGALLGFLPYNFPRASVFLGDSGSHLVGFLLAVLSILPHFYSARQAAPSRWAVLCPLFLLAVPLADLSSVVWIRTRARRPFWIGDTNHFSHRLVRAGWSRPQAVLILWALALITGAVTLVL
ncbi:MAG: undecaprenyl/decaprenyl-phosphate alpha-N-acetylglucosaminyl 1-phosphate transferase [Verrucomicrobiae bacterium]|nr:undecaprenyl/decaprenyl-phosphate alpha-N-acetylglucosaminyl 1-phosphate transferase [Verrucomicrobiae bacterium]